MINKTLVQIVKYAVPLLAVVTVLFVIESQVTAEVSVARLGRLYGGASQMVPCTSPCCSCKTRPIAPVGKCTQNQFLMQFWIGPGVNDFMTFWMKGTGQVQEVEFRGTYATGGYMGLIGTISCQRIYTYMHAGPPVTVGPNADRFTDDLAVTRQTACITGGANYCPSGGF